MEFDGNRVEWVLSLNKLLYGINKQVQLLIFQKLMYKGGYNISIKLTLVYFTEMNHLFYLMLVFL